ncbi:hypothetical protein CPM_0550 [Cuniculiplasma divulgatum]|uniref:Uncharacterized protein n=1 Tax=Cuniculiplasma divulgatum TaxID=1673428 RepID=A0A1R4A620_9ARCH|nr:hypothetical protein CPM_0550 [Cuniculiplasma divulgatum]
MVRIEIFINKTVRNLVTSDTIIATFFNRYGSSQGGKSS